MGRPPKDKTKYKVKVDAPMEVLTSDGSVVLSMGQSDLADSMDFGMRDKMIAIPGEIFVMDVSELKKNFNEDIELLTSVREGFWLEYWTARSSGRKMLRANIIDGICTSSQMSRLINNQYSFSFILKPIMKYEARLNSILSQYGSKVIKEILDQPCVDKEGRFDTTLASLKLRTIKQMEDRLQGTPIQRSESKELRVNIGHELSLEEIEKRIKELDGQIPALAITNTKKEAK